MRPRGRKRGIAYLILTLWHCVTMFLGPHPNGPQAERNRSWKLRTINLWCWAFSDAFWKANMHTMTSASCEFWRLETLGVRWCKETPGGTDKIQPLKRRLTFQKLNKWSCLEQFKGSECYFNFRVPQNFIMSERAKKIRDIQSRILNKTNKK